MDDPTYSAFFDELEKIAASHGLMSVSKSRSGRRPMSVDTLLRKDKDGSLPNKKVKEGTVEPFLVGPTDMGAARRPKKKGDVPSRDDPGMEKREDGRDFAATVQGLGAVSPSTGGGERIQ